MYLNIAACHLVVISDNTRRSWLVTENWSEHQTCKKCIYFLGTVMKGPTTFCKTRDFQPIEICTHLGW